MLPTWATGSQVPNCVWDYRWSHNQSTNWRTVTLDWYWNHAPLFSLQNSCITSACYYIPFYVCKKGYYGRKQCLIYMKKKKISKTSKTSLVAPLLMEFNQNIWYECYQNEQNCMPLNCLSCMQLTAMTVTKIIYL